MTTRSAESVLPLFYALHCGLSFCNLSNNLLQGQMFCRFIITKHCSFQIQPPSPSKNAFSLIQRSTINIGWNADEDRENRREGGRKRKGGAGVLFCGNCKK